MELKNSMDVGTTDKAKKIKIKKQSKMEHKKSKMLKLNKYIYQVLKAINMMNTILTDMMLKLAQKASKHNKIRHKNSPLVEPDISAAVCQVFPEDMIV